MTAKEALEIADKANSHKPIKPEKFLEQVRIAAEGGAYEISIGCDQLQPGHIEWLLSNGYWIRSVPSFAGAVPDVVSSIAWIDPKDQRLARCTDPGCTDPGGYSCRQAHDQRFR